MNLKNFIIVRYDLPLAHREQVGALYELLTAKVVDYKFKTWPRTVSDARIQWLKNRTVREEAVSLVVGLSRLNSALTMMRATIQTDSVAEFTITQWQRWLRVDAKLPYGWLDDKPEIAAVLAGFYKMP